MMTRPLLLPSAIAIALTISTGDAFAKGGDYLPRIHNYLNGVARMQVKRFAKFSAVKALRDRGIAVPERRGLRLGPFTLGGPKVKVKVKLEGARPFGWDTSAQAYRATVTVGGKTYEQHFQRTFWPYSRESSVEPIGVKNSAQSYSERFVPLQGPTWTKVGK